MADTLLAVLPLFFCFLGCSSPDPRLRVYVHTDLPLARDAWTVRVEVAKRAPAGAVDCEESHELSPDARSLGGALVLQQTFKSTQTAHVRVTLCRGGQAAFVRSAQVEVEGEARLSVLFPKACIQQVCAGEQGEAPCTLQACDEAKCGAGLPSCRRFLPDGCGPAGGPAAESTACESFACVHGECLAVLPPASPDHAGDAGMEAGTGGQDAALEDAGVMGRRCMLADGRPVLGPLYGYTLRSRSEASDPEVLARLRSQAFTALRLRVDLDGDLWGPGLDFRSLAGLLELIQGKTLLVQFGASGTNWRTSFAELDVAGPNYFRDAELASYAAFVKDLLDVVADKPSQLVLGAFRRPHRRIDEYYGEPANARSAWLGRPSFDPPEGVVFGDSAAWSGGVGERFVALHETLRNLAPTAILSSNGVDGRSLRSDLLLSLQEQEWLPAWVSASAMQAQLVDLHLLESDLAGTPEDLARLVRKLAGEYRTAEGLDCYVLGETPLERKPSAEAAPPLTTEQARALRELSSNLEGDPGFVGMISSAPPASERPFWQEGYAYEPPAK